MKKINLFLSLAFSVLAGVSVAQEWGNIATVSETTAGYLCAYDPDADGDEKIDCDTLAPYVATDGDIGIGTSNPSRTLTISGTTWTKVLELEGVAGGNGISQTVVGSDNLGNHTATQSLNMSGNDIIAAGNISVTGVTLTNKLELEGVAGGNGISQTIIGADNLGNHTATQDVDLGGYDITNAQDISTTTLQVSGGTGYDCSSTAHRGRIRVDPNTGLIQVCRWD